MSSRSQRRMQMKNAHITAIVVGIFLILGGLYFIFVISGQTDGRHDHVCVQVRFEVQHDDRL